MNFSNLRQFVDVLRKDGDLAVIEAPVDPNLELAEIHRRVIEEEGPALLFTNVKGSTFPVLTNMFGTARRVDLAFGPTPEALMKRSSARLTAAASNAECDVGRARDGQGPAIRSASKSSQHRRAGHAGRSQGGAA